MELPTDWEPGFFTTPLLLRPKPLFPLSTKSYIGVKDSLFCLRTSRASLRTTQDDSTTLKISQFLKEGTGLGSEQSQSQKVVIRETPNFVISEDSFK